MSETFRVGILGAGWAGLAHARGYLEAGGYKLESVVDLIPARVAAFRKEFPSAREAESVEAMIRDPGLEVISICLPTDLHAVYAVKALRAGKHVVVETPPAADLKDMRAMLRAAEKTAEKSADKRPRVLLPAFQRHYGAHEAAARQAVEKGFLGTAYHARATWHRPAGIPQGARAATDPTGWYTDLDRAGGGALIDLGLPLLQLAWQLLGCPEPETVLASTHHPLASLPVEEAGQALVRFQGGKSLELSAAWVLNAPPNAYGVACRVHGTTASLDVYTPAGATLYRPPAPAKPGKQTEVKATLLKGPKVTHHAAMMRHLKSLALGREDAADPLLPARQALTLTAIIDAIYRSARTGKSADVRV